LKSNIKVSQVSPGVVQTEFFLRASDKNLEDVIKKSIPDFLSPNDISEAIIYILSTSSGCTPNDILIRPTTEPF